MATKAIQEIVLTNFKKHKFLTQKVNGNSFLLLGGNGVGKTSVLQAIDHMIRQEPLPDETATEGESEGKIELILTAEGTQYKVVRVFTKAKLGRYTLSRDAGNGRWDGIMPAQERFQEIFGKVIDLSLIIDMSGKEQLAYIQEIIGKDDGVAAAIKQVEENIKKLTEERLMTGRQKRDLEAKMNVPEFRALVNYVGEEPDDLELIRAKKVDVTALNAEYIKADRVNTAADNHIATLRSIVVIDAEINKGIDAVVALFEAKKVDVTELKTQIETADETNAKIDTELEEARKRNELIKKSVEFTQTKENIEVLAKEYDDYTKRIKEEIGSTGKQLAKLGLGEIYEGLSLEYQLNDEGKVEKEGLYLRGMPFNRRQQSYGEMVKILVALSKAFNPDGLCFVKIGYWNELDETNQEAILKLAEENDIQLGIEKVDSSKKLEIQLIER